FSNDESPRPEERRCRPVREDCPLTPWSRAVETAVLSAGRPFGSPQRVQRTSGTSSSYIQCTEVLYTSQASVKIGIRPGSHVFSRPDRQPPTMAAAGEGSDRGAT